MTKISTYINGLTEDTTPDLANDFVMTYDTSATAAKKVKPNKFAPALTTANAALSGDVTMTNVNTFYDGPSVSLTAGTWFVFAGVLVKHTAYITDFTVKLWDGTTVATSTQMRVMTTGIAFSMALSAIVTPGTTTTYKVSAAGNNAAGTMLAACPTNGAGNTATYILAVKIG